MTDALAALYFPTTVYLVDDNQQFLENFSAKLAKKFRVKINSNIRLALTELRDHQYDLKPLLQASDARIENDGGSEALNLNLDDVRQLAFKSDKEQLSTVLIVDYSMPEMNGIEFCRHIRDLPIKKIMLTGEADHRLAVNAFNEGIIDGFVLKACENMETKVTQLVTNLSQRFFVDYSKLAMTSVMQRLAAVQAEYLSLFASLLTAHQIREYYLLDHNGSYLFISDQGKLIVFMMYSKDELDMYIDIARNNNLTSTLLQSLSQYEKAPLLVTEQDHLRSVDEWAERLVDLKPLTITQQFYYSVNTAHEIMVC